MSCRTNDSEIASAQGGAADTSFKSVGCGAAPCEALTEAGYDENEIKALIGRGTVSVERAPAPDRDQPRRHAGRHRHSVGGASA